MSDAPSSSPIQPFRPLPDPTWRERLESAVERLRDLSGFARAAVAVLAAVIVLVIGAFVLRSSAAPPATEDGLPHASTTTTPASSASSGGNGVVVVQAAGAVVTPGLYRLSPGARVDDLVRAAGGFAPDADADRINLAALLSDGQRIYVPRVGEALPADPTQPDAGGGASASAGPIDLNSASVAELDTLPGVGPATAQAIIDYRTQHGRFRSVDDLLDVRGIGPAKLDEIRALVRV